MKKAIIISVLILFSFSMIFAQDEGNKGKKQAQMTFEYTDHDFGTMEQGSDVSCEFIYKNTGKVPLIINNVRKSCGCTTPEWSKEPLGKRKKGTIGVKYDSNRMGHFRKTITVYSNAENSPVVISIQGSIIKKEE